MPIRPRSSERFIEELCGVGLRRAGTDAERRAAWLVARHLRSERREAELETFWCRPNWAMAQAWHVALGILGSLLSVDHARLGGALVLAALLSALSDALWGISPGRRLTPERASQNVVSRPSPSKLGPPGSTQAPPVVRLILTAGLDAGRVALAYRGWLRDRTTRLRVALTGGRAPGWQAWLLLALAWTLLTAVLRLGGHSGAAISALQFIPTVGLLAAFALLLELAAAEAGPGASDNGSGIALALAAARALDAAPPVNASVEVVVAGCSDGQGLGLRRHLRGRSDELGKATAVLVGVGPVGSGGLVHLTSDGPLAPRAFARRLTGLARDLAATDPSLGLRAARGRGVSPALGARAAGLPAVAIACLAPDDTTPLSHRPGDRPDAVDPSSLDRSLRAVLLLVDGIDEELGRFGGRLRPA